MDVSLVRWVPYDGLGRTVRNGLSFTERGFGVRGAQGAMAWSAASGFVEARHRPALEIYDRVGGGDSFASGLIYGLLTTSGLQAAAEYGAAHGALAMTTPGDTSMASLAEVEALMAGAGARVQRLSGWRTG